MRMQFVISWVSLVFVFSSLNNKLFKSNLIEIYNKGSKIRKN